MQAIFPYSAPVSLAPNLWQLTGSLGIPIPRNMTVFRDARGDLVLYSVIALHEDDMRALETLGRPAVMVIPHRRHQLDAPFYKARYPKLRVVAADPSCVTGVTVDGNLSELAEYGIHAYALPGNTYADVVMDMPLADGRALAVCESLSNVPASGWLKLLFKALGPPGGTFGVARAVRLREIRNAPKLREWLRKQAERTDLRWLLFGHGTPLADDIPAALRRAVAQV